MERIDALSGRRIENVLRPFGHNVWTKAFHNKYWWIAHDGMIFEDEKREKQGNTLLKLDDKLRVIAELPLPIYTQGFYFSPDNALIYVFFFKNQVMVVNTESLHVENVLYDKSYLGPLGFDTASRFWLQRDNSTIEAWDARLTRTLSRHKLKGEIIKCHKDAQGDLCVAAWHKKEKILRVYKLVNA